MKDYIPAGAGEKMQYMVHPFNDNTIRFVLRYPAILDADVLRRATLALVSSVDVMHASFAVGNRSAHWQINSISAEDCFTCITTTDDPAAAGLVQALSPISPDARAQMRCILVQGERDCAVVLLISHLCADGSDGKYLLYKLCEAYDMVLQTGGCTGLNVKNGSRAVEQVYSQLSRQDRLRLLKDPRSGVKSEFPFPSADAGEPMVLWRCIPAEKMAPACHVAKGRGATVNDLLLTACYYAYAEIAGLDSRAPVSIMSMMDLRRHCEGGDSQGLCNLTGALSTALPDGLGATFEETLACITAQTRRSKEDPMAGLYGMPLLHGAVNRLPMNLLLAAASHLYGSIAVGLTNLGSMDRQNLQMGSILPAEGWFGGPVKRKPGMQISAVSLGGTCMLCIWGYAVKADQSMLEQLLDCMVQHVVTYGGD